MVLLSVKHTNAICDHTKSVNRSIVWPEKIDRHITPPSNQRTYQLNFFVNTIMAGNRQNQALDNSESA